MGSFALSASRLHNGLAGVRKSSNGGLILQSTPGTPVIGVPPRVARIPEAGDVDTLYANAPSVTYGHAGDPTALTGSKLIDYTSSRFQRLGTFVEVGATFPNSTMLSPDNAVALGHLYSGGMHAYRYGYYGRYCELYTKSSGANWNAIIDGRAPAGTMGRASSGDIGDSGSTLLHKIDCGFVGLHDIIIEGTSNFFFGGIRREHDGAVYPPLHPKGESLIFLGDSWTEGTGATYYSIGGYVRHLGHIIGNLNLANSGSGGCGYIADNNGGRVPFISRVQTDIINRRPDAVCFGGGLNDLKPVEQDHTWTVAQFKQRFKDTVQLVQNGVPGVRVIVYAAPYVNGSPTQGSIDLRNAMGEVAIEVGAELFVDPIVTTAIASDPNSPNYNLGWITGQGYIGHTTGEGNADKFIIADHSHPSDEGHIYLAARIAAEMAASGKPW